MPVLKTHRLYGVTASIKNYMGVVSSKLTRNSHSSIGVGGMGTIMRETRMSVLNIIDAIYVDPGTGRGQCGPYGPYERAMQLNTIIAGLDPVALDYWSTKNILMPAVTDAGYEITNLMDPDSISPGDHGNWLRLSMIELKKGGYDVTIGDENIIAHIR